MCKLHGLLVVHNIDTAELMYEILCVFILFFDLSAQAPIGHILLILIFKLTNLFKALFSHPIVDVLNRLDFP